MSKRNMALKRQQKALKRKKKKQAQHAHEKSASRTVNSADHNLPNLSKTLLDFAAPVLGDSDDQEYIEGIMAVIHMCWNIGTVNYQLAEEMRAELDKIFVQEFQSLSAEELEELERQIDLLIVGRRTFFSSDPRLVVEYDLQWNMFGEYNLQVKSAFIPDEERFDPNDKEHFNYGLSARTQQTIAELDTPATEEQAPSVELIQKGRERQFAGEFIDDNILETCDFWLEAWENIKTLYQDVNSIDSIKPFAGILLSQWCEQLEMTLHNAWREDVTYLEKRIQYCREFCEAFPESDEGIIHNMLRAEAESLFFSGQHEQGEAKFKQLVEKFPDDAWSYIGWGDIYNGTYTDLPENLEKAEELYKIPVERGLKYASDAEDRLDDLLTLLEDRKSEHGRVFEHEAQA
ncbi:tetratricopeptide repeat protein [Endozoicomonas montiporae]|uniref:SEC-C motif domain-containing protein n=1 Tax=Endozoicomonas montiporae CL-33 TaxID=570277 RepID=A0A142BHM3_9GAMM|nr:hypothetical protein [Endozoicomonas montiporae]AMO58249.1 SEC-C motif domain-containing protein [Endozoicomonas montiporae CL-33]